MSQLPDLHSSLSISPKLAEVGRCSVVSESGRGVVVRLVSDFVNLTKPGVMGLLLISTACPMILAAGGRVSFALVVWALIGGALVSGSASAVNCIWDRDIDAVMERTKNRPLAAKRLSPFAALMFALALGVVGLFILAAKLNLYAAAVALFGHLFYVLVYTIWLKRLTPQNIVIGGAAGAIPPIVGWVGVTGSIDTTALLLFLIVFLWTPPHFWALALNKNSDYRLARVPMLPVVAGERATVLQMLVYALLLLPASIALVLVNPHLGWFSGVVLALLGALFLGKICQLWKLTVRTADDGIADEERKTKKAWDVFGFSLVYLALFFGCLVLDSALM